MRASNQVLLHLLYVSQHSLRHFYFVCVNSRDFFSMHESVTLFYDFQNPCILRASVSPWFVFLEFSISAAISIE
jgi:hypothetical protein